MGVPLSRLRRDFPGRGPVDEKLALTHLLFLCRVNAIQALYKEKIEPTSDVVSAQLTSISEVFSKMVSECEKWWGDKELRSLGKKGSSGDPIERITGIIAGVSRAFDDNLLDHLQGKVDLMKKLKDYLPAHGPMSAEFLRHIDNESKAIFRNTQPRALVKDLFKFKELTRKLMSEDLKKSGQSQSTPGKRKIAVFYATDRVWRNGLPRTKAGRLRYGVHMGSRALIEALTKLSGGNDKVFLQRRPVLKNVILVAADEGLSKFEDMLNKMNNGNSVPEPLISVYSSTRDRALYASALFQRCSRLGSTFSFFVKHSMRGRDRMVDVIDATGVFNHNILGHSYHAKAPEVLTDIQNLLRDSYRRAVERPLIQFKHGPGMDKDPGTDEEDEDPGTDEEDEDPGTDEEDEDPGMDEEDEDPGTDEEDEDLAEWVFHAIKQSWWDKYIKKNPKSGVSKILNSASSTRVRDGCEKLNNLREIS
ncbi:unnamed protein product [Sphagnum balticum]